MKLEKFNKAFNNFKANFIFEATQKKNDEDKYHYSYGHNNIEIRDEVQGSCPVRKIHRQRNMP